MAYPAVPHMAFPFAINAGEVAVDEQDDITDIVACVTLIASIPQGSILELPELGAPDLAFSQQPVDPQVWVRQILAEEPRATVDMIAGLTSTPSVAQFTADIGAQTDSEVRNG